MLKFRTDYQLDILTIVNNLKQLERSVVIKIDINHKWLKFSKKLIINRI